MKKGAEKTEIDKITFRVWPPYTKRIMETAKLSNLKPNQFARIATLAFSDSGLLDLNRRMKRLEKELVRFRKDFNEAVAAGSKKD